MSLACPFARFLCRTPLPFPARKAKFVNPHVHAAPAKSHAFGFEAQALLNCRISPELDFPSCTNDPVPG